MSKSTQRCVEAISLEKPKPCKLTDKQYLVYAYLLSISKWNAETKEHHYYIYKNSFTVKDACEFLQITQPTWRAAIAKLKSAYYITEDNNKFYKIRVPNLYTPIELDVIKELITYGTKLGKEYRSGYLVSVYSTLSRYFVECQRQGIACEITAGQLRELYSTNGTKKNNDIFRMMLGLFFTIGLISMEVIPCSYNGVRFLKYRIKNIATCLPKAQKVNYGEQTSLELLSNIEEQLAIIED